ncbi:MAG TPA: chloroperoxidase [Blastocatellia bacterium]|nr:chloroperoxidase [Blastocatellia bacterium]
MSLKRNRSLIFLTLAIFCLGAAVYAGSGQFLRTFEDFWGERYGAPSSVQFSAQSREPVQLAPSALRGIRRWNAISYNASGLDHTPLAPGEDRVFGHQLGPGRSARAMAITHIAIFEAVNAIDGTHKSYVDLPRANGRTSMEAAVAQAAHDTLVALYPSMASTFDTLLAEDIERIPDSGKLAGINLGKRAAKAVLDLRADDGSQHAEPLLGAGFTPSDDAGKWRQDPISLLPVALGARWAEVRPFGLLSASQFRIPPPPAMDTPEYAAAYNEVQRLGGDGVNTPTERTDEQTEIGIFWAYDGTPSLCAPPRLYNQIAVQIADQMRSTEVELARLLALINTAMADAGIASWESKFFYQCWRPVTGIREADEGTGPGGSGDGNPETAGDADFSPLGAPASNLMGPNFTPPFPAYPSGHATFGGALFETLRRFYGTDDVTFTFVSDELNGVTVDNEGNVRPLKPRTFTSFSQAEEENGQSRIYLGIHWSFDKTEGIAQGRDVAEFIFKRLFVPNRKPGSVRNGTK